jgi:flagellar basal body-associated protein FliL
MKKKLIIILLVVVAGGGFAAKTFLLPKPAVAKPKIDGEIYVLPKGFTLNLTDGRYATMTIGLILAPGQSDGAVIRSIITNTITNDPSSALLTDGGRAKLKSEILSEIKSSTDVKVNDILFTDLAVQ